jgi:hypothetical protein
MDLMLAARDEAFARVLERDTSRDWHVWMNAVRNMTERKIAIV